MSSDVPTDLIFADEVETTYRIAVFAEAGEGKTLAAATAPGPMVVLNADRPASWQVAKRRHPDKDIRETRYLDHASLDGVYRYVTEHPEVATVVIDTVSNVYDSLVAAAPLVKDNRDGQMKPDYELVNKKLLQFIARMRTLDVHLVLVAHCKENEGKKGDGRSYPRFGGMGLIRKVNAEMDIVGFIARHDPEEGEPTWFAQLQPTENLYGKDGTDSLGARRVADLTRWIELAHAANVTPSGDVDLPWTQPTPSTEEAGRGDLDDGLPVGTSEDAAPPILLPQGEAPIDATLEAARKEAEGEELTDEERVLLDALNEPVEEVELTAEDLALLDAVAKGKGLVGKTAALLKWSTDDTREAVKEIKTKLHVKTNVALLEVAERRLAA